MGTDEFLLLNATLRNTLPPFSSVSDSWVTVESKTIWLLPDFDSDATFFSNFFLMMQVLFFCFSSRGFLTLKERKRLRRAAQRELNFRPSFESVYSSRTGKYCFFKCVWSLFPLGLSLDLRLVRVETCCFWGLSFLCSWKWFAWVFFFH